MAVEYAINSRLSTADRARFSLPSSLLVILWSCSSSFRGFVTKSMESNFSWISGTHSSSLRMYLRRLSRRRAMSRVSSLPWLSTTTGAGGDGLLVVLGGEGTVCWAATRIVSCRVRVSGRWIEGVRNGKGKVSFRWPHLFVLWPLRRDRLGPTTTSTGTTCTYLTAWRRSRTFQDLVRTGNRGINLETKNDQSLHIIAIIEGNTRWIFTGQSALGG